MEIVTEKEEEILLNIKEALTNNDYGQESKLQAIRNLKEIFKKPYKIFSKVKLESLLPSARFALECKALEKEFLFNYGSSLVGFVGRSSSLDPELLYQLEHVLTELKKLNEKKADTISDILWSRLEINCIVLPNGALTMTKQNIEKIALNWVEATCEPRLEFPAKMAAASPQLFQNFSAVLYQVLRRSGGHLKVLNVIKSFINSVMSICVKEEKDFLMLYPKDCCQLVSLLMVSPQFYSEKWTKRVKKVNYLLSEMFQNDRNKALVLLSHYSDWVEPFVQYLNNTQEII